MITYLIAWDLGDGETTGSAWEIGQKGFERVRFKDTGSLDEAAKIPSVIWRKKSGDGYAYSLVGDNDYLPFSSFKEKINELDDNKREIFKHFIQELYRAMLKNNPYKKDGNDFRLFIAAPTKWSMDDKEAYRKFVEEAIGEIDKGRQVEWVLSESDAAYYNKSTQNAEWILVVDYGSSTIDFTLMHGRNKQPGSDNFSCKKGAREIEMALYEKYLGTKSYKMSKELWDKKLKDAGKDEIDPAGFLRLGWRKAKERMYTDSGGKDASVSLMCNTLLYQYAGIQLEDEEQNTFFVYTISKPESKVEVYSKYKEEIQKLFKSVKDDVEKLCKEDGMKTLKVVLTGGASRMGWVKMALEDLFGQEAVFSKEDGQTEALSSNNTSNVEKDDRPEYVVSDGVVKYAKLLYEVEQEVNKVMDEVMGDIGELQAKVGQQAASVCRDMWKELFKNHSEVQAYCSEGFNDFTIPDNDPENFDKNYYHSSIKNFSLNISKNANDQMRKDMGKIKEMIADNLRTVLSENLSKCFKHLKTINLEKQNISVQITKLPDVDSNFSLSPEKAIAELSDKLVGIGNTKYGKYKFQKGTYRKARSTSERVQIVDDYVNLINDVNYVPYDKGKIRLIRKCIYESTLHGIVEAVQEHLMFKPCGYDMEKKLRDRFGMLITVVMGKEVLGHSYVGIVPEEGDVVYCKDKDGVVKSSTVCSFRQVPTGTYYMLLEDDALADCEGCWCYTK